MAVSTSGISGKIMDCPCCKQSSSAFFCQSCVQYSLQDLIQLLHKRRRKTSYLNKEFESKLNDDADSQARLLLVAQLADNIKRYEAAASESRIQLKSQTEALKQRKEALQNRRLTLQRARAQLSQTQALTSSGKKNILSNTLRGISVKLKNYSERVSLLRKKLLMQLIELLPINIDAETQTIATLPLPPSVRLLRDTKQDAHAAALAMVVRMLLIASGYLSLVLPYKMEFLGSQASIGRWGLDEPQIVISGIGADTETGMAMLRKNVEALCFYQGIPVSFVKDRGLGHSLWQLFHSPSLGNSVYHSLLKADSRLARVPPGRSLSNSNVSMDISTSSLVPSNTTTLIGVKTTTRISSDGAVERRSAVVGTEKSVSPLQTKSQSVHESISTGKQDDILTASVLSYGSEYVLFDEQDEDDEWDLMERPQPPKPSKDDDILHWVSSGA